MSEAVLRGRKIALLATDGFEDTELTEPLSAVRDAGAQVLVIADKEKITGENGTEISADLSIDQATVNDFDGLLLPGGVKNPDNLRQNETAVDLVRDFSEQGKPIAAICHAPWMLAEADVIQERTLTSWPSLKTDIRNAGGHWVDEEVVVDQNLVTSRKPDDLEAFCAEIVTAFAEEAYVAEVL